MLSFVDPLRKIFLARAWDYEGVQSLDKPEPASLRSAVMGGASASARRASTDAANQANERRDTPCVGRTDRASLIAPIDRVERAQDERTEREARKGEGAGPDRADWWCGGIWRGVDETKRVSARGRRGSLR